MNQTTNLPITKEKCKCGKVKNTEYSKNENQCEFACDMGRFRGPGWSGGNARLVLGRVIQRMATKR